MCGWADNPSTSTSFFAISQTYFFSSIIFFIHLSFLSKRILVKQFAKSKLEKQRVKCHPNCKVKLTWNCTESKVSSFDTDSAFSEPSECNTSPHTPLWAFQNRLITVATVKIGGDWPQSLSFLSGQVWALSVKLALDWFKLPGGQQIPNQAVSIWKREAR